MKRIPSPPKGPIIPHTLIALFAYVMVVKVVHLYGMATLTFPEIEESTRDGSPMWTLVAVLTVIHVAFAVLLARIIIGRAGVPIGLRRGHVAGAVLGLVVVVTMQWSLVEGVQAVERIASQMR
ncbi:MAG: hypothetical protein AAF726_05475 [Planctomycetota bacterium]